MAARKGDDDADDHQDSNQPNNDGHPVALLRRRLGGGKEFGHGCQDFTPPRGHRCSPWLRDSSSRPERQRRSGRVLVSLLADMAIRLSSLQTKRCKPARSVRPAGYFQLQLVAEGNSLLGRKL